MGATIHDLPLGLGALRQDVKLDGDLDECMGDMVAQHDGLKTVTVRHDCSSTDGCKGRVAQGDWFKRAKVGRRRRQCWRVDLEQEG
jgi:hypothetical protein